MNFLNKRIWKFVVTTTPSKMSVNQFLRETKIAFFCDGFLILTFCNKVIYLTRLRNNNRCCIHDKSWFLIKKLYNCITSNLTFFAISRQIFCYHLRFYGNISLSTFNNIVKNHTEKQGLLLITTTRNWSTN